MKVPYYLGYMKVPYRNNAFSDVTHPNLSGTWQIFNSGV